MYAIEQERSHPIPPPPPLSMDRIPPPASAYPTPGSAGPLRSSDYLAPVSTIHDGRIWSLHVVQQPIRARMCGFGDKVNTYMPDATFVADSCPSGSQADYSTSLCAVGCEGCGDREGNRYQVWHRPLASFFFFFFFNKFCGPNETMIVVKSTHRSTCSPSTCGTLMERQR